MNDFNFLNHTSDAPLEHQAESVLDGNIFALQEDTGTKPESKASIEDAESGELMTGSDVLELGDGFDYEGFQVVRREFFAHVNEPSITFNNYKVSVNTACLNRLPTVENVQVLVNRDTRVLAIRPCFADDRDAFAWCSTGTGKRKPRQITCRLFFAKVFSMMNWNPDYRYKLLGRVIHANDEYLIAFDLTATEVYQRIIKEGEKPKNSRKPVFPEGWQNQFGLPFKEHRKSMQINIFDGYAVYGIRDNAAGRDTDPTSAEQQMSITGGTGHE